MKTVPCGFGGRRLYRGGSSSLFGSRRVGKLARTSKSTTRTRTTSLLLSRARYLSWLPLLVCPLLLFPANHSPFVAVVQADVILGSGATKPWINEFHHLDQVGDSSSQFLEIAGPAGLDVTGAHVCYYLAMASTVADFLECREITGASGTLGGSTVNGVGFLVDSSYLPVMGIPGDEFSLLVLSLGGTTTDGDNANVWDVICVKGSLVGNDKVTEITGGPARGMIPPDVGVFETSGQTSPTTSVQRTDVPPCTDSSSSNVFQWTVGQTQTRNAINVGQSVTCTVRDTTPTTTTTTSRPTAAPVVSSPPTSTPSTTPTVGPTVGPTSSTRAPTSSPTADPSAAPTSSTRSPTSSPTAGPSSAPTSSTRAPTSSPTSAPSATPNTAPPTASPNETDFPTRNPSTSPTKGPTTAPTRSPTTSPTQSPSRSPTTSPTRSPTTSVAPTKAPTTNPSRPPTNSPTKTPNSAPTGSPTKRPSSAPSIAPTKSPTGTPITAPTQSPTKMPSAAPTKVPSAAPTKSPTNAPSSTPTQSPTKTPSTSPTKSPTARPTTSPTVSPTAQPTAAPTSSPTDPPSSAPTLSPTLPPVGVPTVPVNFAEPFINEFSYNQQGGDFLEIACPDNSVLSNYFVSFYLGNHTLGRAVSTVPLTSAVLTQGDANITIGGQLRTLFTYFPTMSDFPEPQANVSTASVAAIALARVASGAVNVLDFVSYGGRFATTLGGMADGEIPHDVGVLDSGNDVTSVQLLVNGNGGGEAEWITGHCATPGKANRAFEPSSTTLEYLADASLSAPWINEIHYLDAASPDTQVFVEVAGPAAMDVTGFILALYRGSHATGASLLACVELEGTLNVGAESLSAVGFLTTTAVPFFTLDPSTQVVGYALSASLESGIGTNTALFYDYISINGIGSSAPSSTLNGPAQGLLPQDTFVVESFPETTVGTSMQRTDVPLCTTSTTSAVWTTGNAETRNGPNVGQALGSDCAMAFNILTVTANPTPPPSLSPTTSPPTHAPTTSAPTTRTPTQRPTAPPTAEPSSAKPSPLPSHSPSPPPTTVPSHHPTAVPTTVAPVPTLLPSNLPSLTPSQCPPDDFRFVFLRINDSGTNTLETCEWISRRPRRIRVYCGMNEFSSRGAAHIRENCPQTCGVCGGVVLEDSSCDQRFDNESFTFVGDSGNERDCRWIASSKEGASNGERVRRYCGRPDIAAGCAKTCSDC